MNGHSSANAGEAQRSSGSSSSSSDAGADFLRAAPPAPAARGGPPAPRVPRPETLARAASQALAGRRGVAVAAEELSRDVPDSGGKKKRFTRIAHETEVPPLEDIVKKILTSRVYELAKETPISAAPILSGRVGNQVLIKREDLQPVFSFKIRGAYNLMAQLTAEQKALGVIAASAGNHAQGVAIAASVLGISAVIVMPTVTPSIKVDAVRARGAEVVLVGDCFDDALEHCMTLLDESGRLFIPPYDHLDIIAGQGTCGMEILRQLPGRIDAIFVPVGGGGLISGMAAYIKYLRPEIQVIGVESFDSACLKAALEAGTRVRLSEVGVFADGVSVALVGKNPWNLIRTYDLVDDVITVTTDEICAAVKDVFDDTRGVCEPAGAISIAGMKKYVVETGAVNETLVCINSGANTNFERLRYISERTELGEQREAILAVTFPEDKGRFMSIVKAAFGKRLCTELVYRREESGEGQVYIGVRVEPGTDDRNGVIESLRRDPALQVYDLTESELAKQHIRHLGGGRGVVAGEDGSEMLFRFEFPERPGALLKFVTKLPSEWIITLFHYSNHGTAQASALCGLFVPTDDAPAVTKVFDDIGYRYWNESDNLSYKLFIRPRSVQSRGTSMAGDSSD